MTMAYQVEKRSGEVVLLVVELEAGESAAAEARLASNPEVYKVQFIGSFDRCTTGEENL